MDALTPEVIVPVSPGSILEYGANFAGLRAEIEREIATLAASKSELTQAVYREACRDFVSTMWNMIIQTPEGLQVSHLECYIGELKKRGLRQTTITKKLSGISALFEKLVRDGKIRSNPVKALPASDRKRGKPKRTAKFKPWEVRAIFDALNPRTKNYHLHRAVLAVGFYTGLRSAEIRSLTVGSFVQSEGCWVLRTKIKHRHHEDEHTVVVHPRLKEILDGYLVHLQEEGVDFKRKDGLLFTCNRQGYRGEKPLTHAGLTYIFNAAIKRAGIELDGDKRYSPHSMRKTLGNHLKEKDVPLHRIQEIYGHASADTTVGYLDKDEGHAHSGIWQIGY
ncbi:MAG: site-specific integrase [Deltaproteobacteria bacterium]|nr:site-specific integrase [Deltaproteobacteria bacterium]